MKILGVFLLFVNSVSTVLADDNYPAVTKPNTPKDHPGRINPNKTSLQRITEKTEELKQVTVFKCCPARKSLDVSNLKQPYCVDVLDHDSPLAQIKGLDLDKNTETDVQMQLTNDQRKSFMPSCYDEFEVHRIEKFGIEANANKENNYRSFYFRI